jgi:hypothetical protein
VIAQAAAYRSARFTGEERLGSIEECCQVLFWIVSGRIQNAIGVIGMGEECARPTLGDPIIAAVQAPINAHAYQTLAGQVDKLQPARYGDFGNVQTLKTFLCDLADTVANERFYERSSNLAGDIEYAELALRRVESSAPGHAEMKGIVLSAVQAQPNMLSRDTLDGERSCVAAAGRGGMAARRCHE